MHKCDTKKEKKEKRSRNLNEVNENLMRTLMRTLHGRLLPMKPLHVWEVTD